MKCMLDFIFYFKRKKLDNFFFQIKEIKKMGFKLKR